jgi:hypothetical protein
MGVNWHHVKALMGVRRAGIPFGRVLTVGRLNLFISPHELKELLKSDAELIARYDQFLAEHPAYAEPLYKLLGATEVESIDASGYENATHVHDLNQPIPDGLKQQYDFVDDGGTLEHVFNFPTAIRNCMEMVKVGGRLQLVTPANNYFGHGFYQFSPDLFYRVLSPENGFEMERLIVHEAYDASQWYEVPDPRAVRSRIELVNDGLPVMMMVRAKRVAAVPIFEKTPQQSDYQAAWVDGSADVRSLFLQKPDPLRTWIKRTIDGISPGLFERLRVRKAKKGSRRFSFESQPKLFKPVDA